MEYKTSQTHKITHLWSQQSSLVQNHSMLFYCNFNPSSLAVLLCCGFFFVRFVFLYLEVLPIDSVRFHLSLFVQQRLCTTRLILPVLVNAYTAL